MGSASAGRGSADLESPVAAIGDRPLAPVLELLLRVEGRSLDASPKRSGSPERAACDTRDRFAEIRGSSFGAFCCAALLASEQVGVATRCLEDTVAYLQQRRQFGRVLASYQALKHRVADLFIQVSSAEAAASYAAACAAAGDPDLPVAVAVAQGYCSGVAVRAAEEAVQLHGGIGMTWEHPTHLYLKRAKSSSLAFGTADQHRAALATLLDLPPA